jgi:hypothetical protein
MMPETILCLLIRNACSVSAGLQQPFFAGQT